MEQSNRSIFERCALASGLLTEEQFEEARRSVRWSNGDQSKADAPPTDRQLADRLVETGKLNAWQAKQLLDGRTKFNLGPYRIIDSIGQGGMGQVFKAEHDVMGRIVAVKVLPRYKSTPEAIANFTREIRALASLDHPKLVRALDAGHDGNVYYLVCEYVPGTDLRKLVRREGALNMYTAAGIVSQVAEGLGHAHQQGLIHRDVKPGNVLVTPEGEAKLSDLGLAGPLEGDTENDPRFGKIVGTVDYLSPDHVKEPWEPTPAWDVYSLGCTLYYAVTGKVPFPGGSTSDKARAHCELRPLDPRRLNPELSDAFVDTLADMMAKDPDERIQSAAEVIERLSPWLGGPPPPLPPPVVAPPLKMPPLPTARTSTPPPLPLRKGAAASQLADTKSDFPEVPRTVPGGQEGSSLVVEMGDAGGLVDDDDSSSLEMELQVPPGSVASLHPAAVLVLVPLMVVVTVIVIWLLLRSLLP